MEAAGIERIADWVRQNAPVPAVIPHIQLTINI